MSNSLFFNSNQLSYSTSYNTHSHKVYVQLVSITTFLSWNYY